MKPAILTQIIVWIVIFLAAASFCFGQNPTPATTPEQTEIMNEDDRLPFMQHEQAPAMAEPSSGGLLLKTLGAMLLVVGLIFGGAWGAKKFGFGNFNSKATESDVDLVVLTSVSLGSGRTISTVRFGERVLLVGSTPQTFTLLAEEKSGTADSLLNSRSVADLLEEETVSFEREFDDARTRLAIEDGGQIS